MITVVSYHFTLPIPCKIKLYVLPLPSLMRSPAMEVWNLMGCTNSPRLQFYIILETILYIKPFPKFSGKSYYEIFIFRLYFLKLHLLLFVTGRSTPGSPQFLASTISISFSRVHAWERSQAWVTATYIQKTIQNGLANKQTIPSRKDECPDEKQQQKSPVQYYQRDPEGKKIRYI